MKNLEKETIMIRMPRFNKIVLGKSRGHKYIMIPLDENSVDYIRSEFRDRDNNDIRRKPIPIECNGFTIYPDDVVLFGESQDFKTEETKKALDEIITHDNPLTVPVPIDLDKLEMGNKLNTGATAYQYYLYALGLIGNPENVLIFRT